MKLGIFGFRQGYEAGKTGPALGRLGWVRFSYADFWPGIVFAICISAGIRGCWFHVDEMRREGFSVFPGLVFLVFLWWTYSFLFEFCYWLGVQCGITLRKREREDKRRE